MPIRTEVLMGTLVTIHVVPPASDDAIDRAFAWFREIEERCTRFDPRSELMQLTRHVDVPVPVSRILFEAVRFALSVARDTNGAFDPTIGGRMEARGFNRHDSTGMVVRTAIGDDGEASYRDVDIDVETQTITLRRPLVLDLGAVAKGLAIDAAARELQPFTDFAIDAGGDLYLGGRNPDRAEWSVGIRHPRLDGALIHTLRVADRAVCTSGDYERRVDTATDADLDALTSKDGEHHIIDPRSGRSPNAVASVTVIAPNAMLADALATAAFVLGPVEGLSLLERHRVEGLIVTPALEQFVTRGFPAS